MERKLLSTVIEYLNKERKKPLIIGVAICLSIALIFGGWQCYLYADEKAKIKCIELIKTSTYIQDCKIEIRDNNAIVYIKTYQDEDSRFAFIDGYGIKENTERIETIRNIVLDKKIRKVSSVDVKVW